MVNRWCIAGRKNLSEERRKSLDFDPRSAFVVAEVSQILQKGNREGRSNQGVDLGGGLVLHDFDEAASQSEMQSEMQNEDRSETSSEIETEQTQANPSSPGAEWVGRAGGSGKQRRSEDHVSSLSVEADNARDSESEASSSPGIPWFLLAGLGVVTILVLVLRVRGIA